MRRIAIVLWAALLLGCEGPAPSPDPAVPAMRHDALFAHRHESMLARPDREQIELVFLGDSIWRRLLTDGRAVWKSRYAARCAANFAIEGDRTEHVLWRIEHGLFDGMAPELVLLLIGTNNLIWNDAGDVARGVAAIVEALERRLPETRVLLMALLPRGRWTPDDPLRRRIEQVNARLSAFAQSRGLAYADLGDRLLGPDGAIVPAWMPDRLHPSAEGYARLADGLAPYLDRILGESGQSADVTDVPGGAGACAEDDPR